MGRSMSMGRYCLKLISALASLGLVFLTAGQSVAAEARPVALELVLAVDVSASVDAREYALQRDGIVAAFRDPRVTETIESLGPQGLAVSLVQWAASWEQAVVVVHTSLTVNGSHRVPSPTRNQPL